MVQCGENGQNRSGKSERERISQCEWAGIGQSYPPGALFNPDKLEDILSSVLGAGQSRIRDSYQGAGL
jgi:hypothetical protein